VSDASFPVRLLADLLLVTVLVWFEFGRLRRLLADALAPGR
jgi:hypothetical protein